MVDSLELADLKDDLSEEIDTADTLSEARYLKRKYETTYGTNWFIFIKKKRVRVNDDA